MLFDVPFIADWSKIEEYRQNQTDKNTRRENNTHIDWDYQPGHKVRLQKMVSSAKPKAGMKVILGPSRQFIRMAP
eukprot:CCRYP_006560-RA/>CCRYP_006560-RA protein AED:0.33 eAED:0.33 QI:0/-1/0/1/-1/0/1/0/74